ncbi:Acetylesterase [Lachnellula suecica]|uniref:Acetylesterase n=1 Tax=Lachnellula suecica TaxID=602035 RepID=A0A8T9CAG0_9HELO|nr:Acetylesterase [Lachnellula suecica]
MRGSLSLLIAASAVVVKAGPWVTDFKNLVAFGDSYTDESRLSYFIAHNGTAPPPGQLTPFSNDTAGGGVTWDRWVADYTGAMLYDYAVAGAVCDNDIIYRVLSSVVGPFPDVVYEIGAFEDDISYINATTKSNTLYTDRGADNTVYSMWIGTNDLGVNAFITDSSLHSTLIPDYIDCIYNKFDAIYKAGGRYFVLMNTAPLQLSPLYGVPGAGGVSVSQYWPNKKPQSQYNLTEISYKMKEYTQLVNSVFAYRTPFEMLIAKRYPGAKMAVYDVHSLLTDVYNNPEQYLTSPVNVTAPYNMCDAAGNCTQSALSLDHYMWFDDLHPSEKTDQAIAHEFVNLVNGNSTYATYY